ncbi:MAG TPA: hypothetical protein VNV66_09855 [Pilimelia sp.]|nr:hypothetical protein [Pilimelia sp.]
MLKRVVRTVRSWLRIDDWMARIIAGLVAPLAALAGAAAVAILTALAAPPEQSHALAVARAAVPQAPSDVPGPVVRCHYWCPDWDRRDNVVAYDGPPDRTDFVRIVFDVPSYQVLGMVTQAHQRLAGAGWRVTPSRAPDNGMWHFEAVKGGDRIRVLGHLSGEAQGPSVQLIVSKAVTLPAAAGVAGGVVTGLLLGWLGTAWVCRRYRRHRRRVRTAMVVTSLPVLLVALLMAGVSVLFLVHLLDDHQWGLTALLLPLFFLTTFPVLTGAAAAGASATAVLAALPGWRETDVGHGGRG